LFNFIYYNTNTVSKPSILFKVNLWFFVNVQYFKNKFSNSIVFFIENMSNLKIKSIKIYFEISDFEMFYFSFLKYLALLASVLFLLV